VKRAAQALEHACDGSADPAQLDGLLREVVAELEPVLAGLGVRAQGHFSLAGGYVSAGLAAAICATLIKAETDTVVVARASAGLAGQHDDAAVAGRVELGANRLAPRCVFGEPGGKLVEPGAAGDGDGGWTVRTVRTVEDGWRSS